MLFSSNYNSTWDKVTVEKIVFMTGCTDELIQCVNHLYCEVLPKYFVKNSHRVYRITGNSYARRHNSNVVLKNSWHVFLNQIGARISRDYCNVVTSLNKCSCHTLNQLHASTKSEQTLVWTHYLVEECHSGSSLNLLFLDIEQTTLLRVPSFHANIIYDLMPPSHEFLVRCYYENKKLVKLYLKS